MEQLKIGLIGAGRIGKQHLNNLLSHEQVIGISVADPQLDEAWAFWQGICAIYDSPEPIFNDPTIDAVFICSPTHTHLSYISQAAEAGKHIFCEKPLALNLDDIPPVLEQVKKSGVILQMGFNRRFDPNFSELKNKIVQNTIGTVQLIRITSRDPELPPMSYIKNSGGLFLDMSIHDLDMVRFLSDADIKTIQVMAARLINPDIKKYNDVDTAIIQLTLDNGALAVVDNSRQACYGYDQRIEVLGSKGSITAHNQKLDTLEIKTENAINTAKCEYFFMTRYQQAYVSEINHFIAAINNQTNCIVDGVDGYKAIQAAYAAKRSFQDNTVITL